jgi:hypothetical protein
MIISTLWVAPFQVKTSPYTALSHANSWVLSEYLYMQKPDLSNGPGITVLI